MYSLLSKRDKRQLDFLEVLMEENPLTLNKISEKTGYSIRTLSADIVQINSYLTPIKIETGLAGISLNIPINSSIREIYTLILKQSRECLLLLYLLSNEDKIQDDIAEELYISLSTLKRILKFLNEELKKKDMFINTNPIFVGGKETNISQLYIALFSEGYHNGEDIMSEDEKNILLELCKNIFQKANFKINYPDLLRVRLWIYIRLIRMKRGHHINDLKDIVFKEKFNILEDKEFCKRFEEIFSMELTNSVLIELFHLFLKPGFAKSFDELEKIVQISPYYSALDNKMQKILFLVSKSLDISTENTEKLRLDLFNIFQFTDNPINILYSKSKIFKKEFSKGNKLIIKKIEDSIDEVFLDSINESAKEEILYLLVTHWPSLLERVKENTPQITLGIFFDSDMEHAQMILDLIKGYSKVKIKVLDTVMNGEEDINSMCEDVDILITNIPELKVDCKEVICIREYPTSTDLRNIILSEERIYQEKILKNM